MNTTDGKRILISIAMALLSSLALAGGDADKGKSLYATQCVSCHGSDGKSDGPAAAVMKPRPTDLTDKAYMKTLSDQRLVDVLKKGGAAVGKSPMMPASNLKDEQIHDMVAFLRTLSK